MNTAILLAGGRGRKFWPYSVVRNKCAFPIANVPIVRRLAESLLTIGFDRLVVVTGYRPGSVHAALSELPRGTGAADPIRFIAQPEPEGTAAAALRGWEGIEDEPLLVVSADLVTETANLTALRDRFAASGAVAAALVQPLADERPHDWITCDVQDGQVSGLQGHGRGGSHRLAGIYAFRAEAARWLRDNPGLMTHVPVGGMPAPEAEIAESLARMIAAGQPVLAVETPGFLIDVDKPWHVLEATTALRRYEVAAPGESRTPEGCRVAESAEIHGRLFMEPGAEIGARVVVRGDAWIARDAQVTNGAILGAGCVIGAGARVRDYALLDAAAVIGPGALVAHGAEFSGILLEGAYLFHYCEISGICGARVDIGAATVCGTLRFDDQDAIHRSAGRAEQPRVGANSTYLGDYSRTGVNAILMPGVKTGAYSCVGPGVILYEDLPDRKMVLARQELTYRDWGPERYGW